MDFAFFLTHRCSTWHSDLQSVFANNLDIFINGADVICFSGRAIMRGFSTLFVRAQDVVIAKFSLIQSEMESDDCYVNDKLLALSFMD
jgi:hypothetical protein